MTIDELMSGVGVTFTWQYGEKVKNFRGTIDPRDYWRYNNGAPHLVSVTSSDGDVFLMRPNRLAKVGE